MTTQTAHVVTCPSAEVAHALVLALHLEGIDAVQTELVTVAVSPEGSPHGCSLQTLSSVLGMFSARAHRLTAGTVHALTA